MLLWSLASWHTAVKNSGQVYIHEDGSFVPSDREIIGKIFPQAKIIDAVYAKNESKVWLKNFPNASKIRNNPRFFFSMKLMDPLFVSNTPYRIIIDTDILWFKEPIEILKHIKDKTSFMSQALLGNLRNPFRFKDGSHIGIKLEVMNSGIVGYELNQYRIDDLEEFCGKIDETSDTHFFEQTGYAWILNKYSDIDLLDMSKYVLKQGSLPKSAVARHYPGPSREKYWFEGIRIMTNRF